MDKCKIEGCPHEVWDACPDHHRCRQHSLLDRLEHLSRVLEKTKHQHYSPMYIRSIRASIQRIEEELQNE